MQTYEFGVLATTLMAAVSLPLAFVAARLCLRGVLWLINAGQHGRSVL
jgi:hypothetical protein